MSGISGRVIEDDRGHVILLAPDHGHALITVKSSRTGKLVQKIATGREFSGKHGPTKQPAIGPRNAALTRSEAAVLLGVGIEEAAKLLDQFEIPRLAAYDGACTRALADRLAQGKKGPVSITLHPEEPS